MSMSHDLSELFRQFLASYDAKAKDEVWYKLSTHFRNFWSNRILSSDTEPISDSDCDEIIKILDRNGKGNTKDSEAVAKAMVAQGAWRRMFNELHSNKELGSLVNRMLSENNPERKAALIDELYKKNEGRKNNMTGPSGNTICAFLAAYDPVGNLSVISQGDRKTLIDFLGLKLSFDWDSASVGTRIVRSNQSIIEGAKEVGLAGSARTISVFFYTPQMKGLWKGEHTVKRADKDVSVTVPTTPSYDEDEDTEKDSVRESMQIQGLIAKIGVAMGYSIWLPKADRGRVLKVWKAHPGDLLEELPLGYDSTTIKTIEQIDVIWLKKRAIARAFEVEHTTSVYSGLLRMADLVALQPNINIKLHIVAPIEKREKVLQEIRRPVFSLLEGRALSEMCSYLSYDQIKEISELKHLAHLSDKVIDDYEEQAG